MKRMKKILTMRKRTKKMMKKRQMRKGKMEIKRMKDRKVMKPEKNKYPERKRRAPLNYLMKRANKTAIILSG